MACGLTIIEGKHTVQEQDIRKVAQSIPHKLTNHTDEYQSNSDIWI